MEVVVELAAAGARARADVVEAHAGGALFGNEFGCGLEDLLPGCAPLRRRGGFRLWHETYSSSIGLASPVMVYGLFSPIESEGGMNELAGKRALVTGGTSGIGR